MEPRIVYMCKVKINGQKIIYSLYQSEKVVVFSIDQQVEIINTKYSCMVPIDFVKLNNIALEPFYKKLNYYIF